MSNNYYLDNEDMRFYIERGIDWEPLIRLIEHEFKAQDSYADCEEALVSYKDMLEMVGKFVAQEIAPRSERLDREKPVLGDDGEVIQGAALTEVCEQMSELGLHMLAVPRSLGGMNAPIMLYMLTAEMIGRADVSTMTHFGFHGGISMALLGYSAFEGSTEFDPETGEIVSTRFQDAISEMMLGEAWGCMDITEPNAGSDMAALGTKAEQDEDGNWFLTGQKIFITSGHGKYHVVIARTADSDDPEDPAAGLGGLSTFVVKGYEDGPDGRERYVSVDRLEHKLGHNASPTCTISFDRTPAELVGEPGEGFRYMLLLMNGARVGVGFESLGLCEAAYRLAKDYAAERSSMGKTIDRHEMIADFLDEMRTEIQAIRALAVDACYNEEMGQKIELLLDSGVELPALERQRLEKSMRRHKRRSRRLTPLLKYHASEKSVELSRLSMQIHGGVGYTNEYGAEKLLRDSLVMPIYEGTSQIQGLMAMKDVLGAIMKRPQVFVRKLADARWRSLRERDRRARALARIQLMSLQAQQTLITRTARDKFDSVRHRPMASWLDELRDNWDPKRDFSFAMLHAERLIRVLIDEAIAEILYDQAERFEDRAELFDRFIERAEPRCRFELDRITNTGRRVLEELHGATEQSAAAE